MGANGRLERYAQLAVRVGANLGQGQLVFVTGDLQHAPVIRAIADAAYREGARYVDVAYGDHHLRRALIANGPDESLTWTPPWVKARVETHGAERSAWIALTGDPEPELLADLDGERVGRARMLELQELAARLVNQRLVNWTVLAAPNEGWARTVFGEPDLERLWQAVELGVRLDEPDPVASWHDHLDRLRRRARALDELGIDVLHFRGGGSDLRVGLLPESVWVGGPDETSWGRQHVSNMPTEEVFTTPDRFRTDGVVRATRPFAVGGTVVRDLELRFESGRIEDATASAGEAVVHAQLDADGGARFLGEVALVDGTSRVGAMGLTFFNTLFDENATSHIAFGMAYETGAPELEGRADDELLSRGLNRSRVHSDVMIGAPDVRVDALTRDGRSVPLLIDNEWQLPE